MSQAPNHSLHDDHDNYSSDNNSHDRPSVSELLAAADSLKSTLRESLTHTNALIAGLKRHRQQSKRLRSAVLSLKQLQAIDA